MQLHERRVYKRKERPLFSPHWPTLNGRALPPNRKQQKGNAEKKKQTTVAMQLGIVIIQNRVRKECVSMPMKSHLMKPVVKGVYVELIHKKECL